MKKKIIILGSTGSLGKSTLDIISNNKKNYSIELLVANKNFKTIYKQIIKFKPKYVYLADNINSRRLSVLLRKNKTKIIANFDEIEKKISKSDIMMSSITGLDGLKYNLSLIKKAKKILFANKESIICGWNLIKKEMDKYNSSYIPVDSEHFAISELIKNKDIKKIKNITITASGGPFFNFEKKLMKNINKKMALNHPRWKMGKKISIDSATMMNKIFEVIEAMKIFNLEKNKIDILIHPKSYLHAIVNFNNGLTKLLAHDTTMEIPITNALYLDKEIDNFKNNNFKYNKLNGLNLLKPDKKNFPLLKILNYNFHNTYLEVILVSINDELVQRYLDDKLSYLSIHKNMLKLLKKPYFTKYYSSRPKNINDVKLMVNKVKDYLNEYLK